MNIHAHFDERVVVHAQDLPWQPSPMQGVDRRPLDRVGGEVARATSIVRYAPDSHFSPHIHTGGEEFFVLEGVFQDEHGDFPAGSYIRNPPESSHTPSSAEGCTIFVKLWQFEADDRTHVNVNTARMTAVPHRHYGSLSVIPLYSDVFETVSLMTLRPGEHVRLPLANGAEVFVLEGSLINDTEVLKQYSWLRLPVTATVLELTSGSKGVRFWLKQGHLNRVEEEIERVSAYRT